MSRAPTTRAGFPTKPRKEVRAPSPVRAPWQRHHAIMRQEAGRDALAADGFADGDDEVRCLVVEPAVQDMRSYRLDDVAGADEGPSRPGHAVRDGGQPVFLAAMDMDDVGAGEPRAHRFHIARVGGGPEPRAEAQGLDPLHAFLTRARHDALLGAAPTDECGLVTGARQLATHLRGPVGVGGPAATRDEVHDLHSAARSLRMDSR